MSAGTEARPRPFEQSREDRELVERLRSGDEAAFGRLVERHHASLLRLARMYVADRATAEEVVQETWLALIAGIDRFEGRSSLKTWLFRVLVNRARTRGAREARTVPFSSLAGDEDDGGVDADRFLPADDRWGGHWASPPRPFAVPDERLLSRETRLVVERAIAELPASQAQVITLRDVEGFDADDVCRLLGLSEGNQRVLLHRARARVRRALEEYLGD